MRIQKFIIKNQSIINGLLLPQRNYIIILNQIRMAYYCYREKLLQCRDSAHESRLLTCEIRVGKRDLLTCMGISLSGSPRAHLKWLPRDCVLHGETSPWTERKEMRIFFLLRGSQVHNFSWKRRFEKMHVMCSYQCWPVIKF